MELSREGTGEEAGEELERRKAGEEAGDEAGEDQDWLCPWAAPLPLLPVPEGRSTGTWHLFCPAH